ncbi:hypothetical protein [Burkholderia sp.]|uniref:hypothetical protein n=1 Tax=Burkholderia sp. TaxID=36773 RepID=UPI0025BC6A52|nr:hypothetical protein [Burkholderia sp.]MBS6359573.1 hypothetical protein [Burkholderia sp.]
MLADEEKLAPNASRMAHFASYSRCFSLENHFKLPKIEGAAMTHCTHVNRIDFGMQCISIGAQSGSAA